MLTVVLSIRNPILETLSMRFRHRLGPGATRVIDWMAVSPRELTRFDRLLVTADCRESSRLVALETDMLVRVWAASLEAGPKRALERLRYAVCAVVDETASADGRARALEGLFRRYKAKQLVPMLMTGPVATDSADAWCTALAASLTGSISRHQTVQSALGRP